VKGVVLIKVSHCLEISSGLKVAQQEQEKLFTYVFFCFQVRPRKYHKRKTIQHRVMNIWAELDDKKQPLIDWSKVGGNAKNTNNPLINLSQTPHPTTRSVFADPSPTFPPSGSKRNFEAPGINLGTSTTQHKRNFEAPGINIGASTTPQKRNFEAPGINLGTSTTPQKRNFEAPGINLGTSNTPQKRNFEAPGINLGTTALTRHRERKDRPPPTKRARESEVLKNLREEDERLTAIIQRGLPPVLTRDMQMQIVLKVFVKTADDIRRISNAAQRSDEWHVARMYRLTGSRIGAAVGQSPYTTPDQLLREMLWPAFKGNAATRRGTLFEPFAGRSYLRFERKNSGPSTELAIPGAVVSKFRPYFAYSPDGIVMCTNGYRKLIEIKCPFKGKPYPRIPPMYMAQMQMGMWLLGLQSCDFVVYCGEGPYARVEVIDDKKMFVTSVPRDNTYLDRMLLPKATDFWFKRFLPLRVALECGWLKRDQVHLPAGIRLEQLDQSVFDELRAEHPF
jgi:putative phage-type endonuclease